MTERRDDVLTRRAALVGMAGATAWTLLACGRARTRTATEPPRIGSAELYPCAPGRLEPAEAERLWRVFAALGGRWGMRTLKRSELLAVLALKTEVQPSYLAEYRSAAALVADPADRDAFERALRSIWAERDLTSPMGHARAHVLAEFIRLHLASGGFRRFGFHNYDGYSAGPRAYRMIPEEAQE